MRLFRAHLTFICASAAIAATAFAQTAAPAQHQYQPRLTPRLASGQAFAYRATATFSNDMRVVELSKKTRADGPPVVAQNIAQDSRENFSAELTVDGALARAVFPNGSLREAAFLVSRCILIHDDGKTETLVPVGAILGVRKQDDGQVAFAINGKPPAPALASRLSLLVQMGDPRFTNDDLLGPPAPVPVGATWPINEKAALHSNLAQIFPGIQRVVGSFTLDSVQTDATGRPIATVEGSYELGGARPPFPPQVQPAPSLVGFQFQIRSPATPGPGQYDIESKSLISHKGRTGDIEGGTMSETRLEINLSLDQTFRTTLDAAQKPLAALLAAPPVPIVAATNNSMANAQIVHPKEIPMQTTVSSVPNPPVLAPLQTPSSPPTQLAPIQQPAPQNPPPLTLPPMEPFSPFSGAQPLPPQPAPHQ